MKSLAIAAVLASAATSAYAQPSTAGAVPSVPKKQTTAPKHPVRPGQLATEKKPGFAKKKYKCYSNCSVFVVLCRDVGGTISHTEDGGTVCTTKD